MPAFLPGLSSSTLHAGKTEKVRFFAGLIGKDWILRRMGCFSIGVDPVDDLFGGFFVCSFELQIVGNGEDLCWSWCSFLVLEACKNFEF